MLDPVELQASPSCYNCLTWSADGELAVAAGEYIHILTPGNASESPDSAGEKPVAPWHFTRFRVSMFTQEEWPTIVPQRRENFSIGPEQSISTVAALSWSSPGLAKYRRCLLAVLTSNLVLSFYESAGLQGKWIRISTVGRALQSYFSQSISNVGLRLRKSRIRSFAWCPPIKFRVSVDDNSPDPVSRWGLHILVVANDDSDLIFLLVKRRRESNYEIEVLSVISLHEPLNTGGNHPMIMNGSLFAAAVRSRFLLSHISCGPWISQPPPSAKSLHSFVAVLGIIHGTKLKTIELNASTQPASLEEPDSTGMVNVNAVERALPVHDCSLHFTGPLQWIFDARLQYISLVTGISTGRAVLTLSHEAYARKTREAESATFRQQLFSRDMLSSSLNADQDVYSRHWEPTSALTVTIGSIDEDATLHLGTAGGWGEEYTCPNLQEEGQLLQPEWKTQLDNFLDRFDIDHDLGGLAVARIWGLAAYRGLVAAAFTMHPGDMVEYSTTVEERITLVFSSATSERRRMDCISLGVPKFTKDQIREARENVLEFNLRLAAELQHNDQWFEKLVYAAAVCVLVEHRNTRLLTLACKALERLSALSGTDLSDEISKCRIQTNSTSVAAKSADKFGAPGADLFEKCDICDSGIEWYSSQEAQCAEGHMFVRCALTFLAIQDPTTSKFCSSCGAEYLDDKVFRSPPGGQQEEGSRSQCRTVFEFFDTCIYCHGKFQNP